MVFSKIGLPNGFEASIQGGILAVKSPKGEVKRRLPLKRLKVSIGNKEIILQLDSKKRKEFSLLKSFEKHIENMVKGLEKGYEYQLRVVYSHFPVNLAVKGNVVEIGNFLGGKKTRVARIVPGAQVEVKGKEIFVRGFDKEAVGQTAANIESKGHVKNRDRRVFQDGIFLVKHGFGSA